MNCSASCSVACCSAQGSAKRQQGLAVSRRLPLQARFLPTSYTHGTALAGTTDA